MSLSEKQIRQLRKLAHHKKAIIIVGQHGLTENVLLEIDNALSFHELIKVRINAADRSARQSIITSICEQTGCQLIQSIGHVAVFFRPSEHQKINLAD